MCGGGQILSLSPNLEKARKTCTPNGKRTAPNLPAVATEANEERNEDCLKGRERVGVSPKEPQCSLQTSSPFEHL